MGPLICNRSYRAQQQLIDEASAKTLIADLQQMPPEDRAWHATFKVLGEHELLPDAPLATSSAA
ncbi:MAG TPA: hypothetical protein VF107_13200 [Burkholderiaceae bacterium]